MKNLTKKIQKILFVGNIFFLNQPKHKKLTFSAEDFQKKFKKFLYQMHS